jgi:rSAM/selenodomain-associated transferase 2
MHWLGAMSIVRYHLVDVANRWQARHDYPRRKATRVLASVIIPTLNEAENIRLCVAAARRSYDADQVEVIVVDNGSVDGTPDLVPTEVTVLHSPRGRAAAMNRGARASRGKMLVFCHGDSLLPSEWLEAVTEALSRPGVSGGTFSGRWVPEVGLLRIGNRLRLPELWPFMLGDQAQFTTRSTFERLGGFPEIPLMEDVEMARALHRTGKLVRLPLKVTTSSRRLQERGVLRQVLEDLWYEVRYLYLGTTAEEIARRYVSSRERATRHDGSQLQAETNARLGSRHDR